MSKRINVLGTEYEILFSTSKEDYLLKTRDGYIDNSTKKIVISEAEDDCELGNFPLYQDKVIRHEIIHAFMFESGLGENWEHKENGQEETVVDWFAIQAPKIYKVFDELGILD